MGQKNDSYIRDGKFRIYSLLLCFGIWTSTGLSQNDKKLSLGEQPIFKASKTDQKITIDGKMNEEIWTKTEARTLDYFYRIDKPSDQQQTTFRMLWDEKNLYLFYQMEDKFLTAWETERDGEPYLDD